MRRNEFQITDHHQIESFLEQVQWGTLAMVSEGVPYQAPVNPVWYEGVLYFHTALSGRKIKAIKTNPAVHFSTVEALSLIPSFFSGEENACNATQFFLSVFIEGKASIEEDSEKKAKILNILMQRLQPEGGYKTIETSDPVYKKEVQKTGIVKIQPDQISAKYKLGQNLSEEMKKNIIEMLRKRGSKIDKLTADWMEKV